MAVKAAVEYKDVGIYLEFALYPGQIIPGGRWFILT